MTGATVAVVVRTKDRPLLLGRALRSAVGQSYQDLVVVVVNDGGPPETVDAVVAEVADDRVRTLHLERTRGRAAAANAGLAATDSELWVLLDDDDSWHRDFLSTTAAHLAAHPACAAAASYAEVVHEHLEGDTLREERRDAMFGPGPVSLVDLTWHNYVTTNSLLVRRAALEDVGGFDEGLTVLEDWDFLLRLVARHPVDRVPGEPLAFWHHRAGAGGAAANSVAALSEEHRSSDTAVRDAALRRDLAQGRTGLGTSLSLAHLVRRLDTEARGARAHESAAADAWRHAQQEHLSSLHTHLSLEVARLRGEVLALREQNVRLAAATSQDLAAVHARLERLQRSVGRVKELVRTTSRPVRQSVTRLAEQVDDLWSADRGVNRMVRRRRKEP